MCCVKFNRTVSEFLSLWDQKASFYWEGKYIYAVCTYFMLCVKTAVVYSCMHYAVPLFFEINNNKFITWLVVLD